jgi:hypothetical protein
MDAQQMNEMLSEMIAEMNANYKEMMAKIDAETKAIQEKTKTIRDKRMETNMMACQ